MRRRQRSMRNLIVAFAVCVAVTASAADWPRDVQSSVGTITIYEPQIDSFKDDIMEARAAVSITSQDSTGSVFGAVWLECHALTDKPSGTVTLDEVKVKDIKFPPGSHQKTAAVSAALE